MDVNNALADAEEHVLERRAGDAVRRDAKGLGSKRRVCRSSGVNICTFVLGKQEK
jgi:hypothetical protein